MPSQKRITRAAIVKTAVDILCSEGYEGVNARKIAKKLNCSTQPIYSEFVNMDELKAELKKEAESRYVSIVKLYTESSGYTPYMAYGLGLIRFAKEDKQLFRYLYMCDRQGEGPLFDDVNMPDTLKVMTEEYSIPEEIAIRFHYDMAIYAYGLAVMLNTGYFDMEEIQIKRCLRRQFIALCGAYGLKNVKPKYDPEI